MGGEGERRGRKRRGRVGEEVKGGWDGRMGGEGGEEGKGKGKEEEKGR